jgi:hypothetical protein
MTRQPDKPVVVPFPAGRRRPSTPPRNLGLTELSKALGPVDLSPKGHWCDRCDGVWYSYFGEARCPVCGSRC